MRKKSIILNDSHIDWVTPFAGVTYDRNFSSGSFPPSVVASLTQESLNQVGVSTQGASCNLDDDTFFDIEKAGVKESKASRTSKLRLRIRLRPMDAPPFMTNKEPGVPSNESSAELPCASPPGLDPLAGKDRLARKYPLAVKVPLARKYPLAGKDPLARKYPLAGKDLLARKYPLAGKDPLARDHVTVGSSSSVSPYGSTFDKEDPVSIGSMNHTSAAVGSISRSIMSQYAKSFFKRGVLSYYAKLTTPSLNRAGMLRDIESPSHGSVQRSALSSKQGVSQVGRTRPRKNFPTKQMLGLSQNYKADIMSSSSVVQNEIKKENNSEISVGNVSIDNDERTTKLDDNAKVQSNTETIRIGPDANRSSAQSEKTFQHEPQGRKTNNCSEHSAEITACAQDAQVIPPLFNIKDQLLRKYLHPAKVLEQGGVSNALEWGRVSNALERGSLSNTLARGSVSTALERGSVSNTLERGGVSTVLNRGGVSKALERGRVSNALEPGGFSNNLKISTTQRTLLDVDTADPARLYVKNSNDIGKVRIVGSIVDLIEIEKISLPVPPFPQFNPGRPGKYDKRIASLRMSKPVLSTGITTARYAREPCIEIRKEIKPADDVIYVNNDSYYCPSTVTEVRSNSSSAQSRNAGSRKRLWLGKEDANPKSKFIDSGKVLKRALTLAETSLCISEANDITMDDLSNAPIDLSDKRWDVIDVDAESEDKQLDDNSTLNTPSTLQAFERPCFGLPSPIAQGHRQRGSRATDLTDKHRDVIDVDAESADNKLDENSTPKTSSTSQAFDHPCFGLPSFAHCYQQISSRATRMHFPPEWPDQDSFWTARLHNPPVLPYSPSNPYHLRGPLDPKMALRHRMGTYLPLSACSNETSDVFADFDYNNQREFEKFTENDPWNRGIPDTHEYMACESNYRQWIADRHHSTPWGDHWNPGYQRYPSIYPMMDPYPFTAAHCAWNPNGSRVTVPPPPPPFMGYPQPLAWGGVMRPDPLQMTLYYPRRSNPFPMSSYCPRQFVRFPPTTTPMTSYYRGERLNAPNKRYLFNFVILTLNQ